MFAAKYRLLTAEGIAPAQALITAFRHYGSVVSQPSFSFDEAFFVVSNLDGIWAASTRTLELGACRRCGCLHLLPHGAAPAAAVVPTAGPTVPTARPRVSRRIRTTRRQHPAPTRKQ